jgi:aryl-alcohol dehydrogenase-like predicted oxidoreductase
MKELQDEGKIAHFGLSEVGMEQIAAARASTSRRCRTTT